MWGTDVTNHLYDELLGKRANDSRTFMDVPGGARISFADLNRHAGQVASALKQMGVEPGDRVAVQVEKSPEAIAVYLGTVRAGGVFLPLNTAYTPSEVEYWLEAEDSNSRTAWLPEALAPGESVYSFVVGVRTLIHFEIQRE